MSWNSIDDVPDDFMHVISLFLTEQRKKKLIKKLHKEDFERIFQVSAFLLRVSDETIQSVKEDAEFTRVYELIEAGIRDQCVPNELISIYHENVRNELECIASDKRKVEQQILGKKSVSYEYLLNAEKLDDAISLLNGELSRCKDKYLTTQHEHLSKSFEQIKNTAFHIDYNLIITKLSGEYPTGRIAFLVCNPSRLCLSRLFSRDIWRRFPMKWASMNISVASLYDIVAEFEKGEDISHYFIGKYNTENGFDNFNEHVNSLVFQHALGEVSNERKLILSDISITYQRGYFPLCVYAALPMIEGMLWDIASYVQKIKGGIFSNGSSKIAVVKNTEKLIKKPKIRQVVSDTHLSDYLDEDFINYFCSELYDERNEALHGRVIPDISASNAGKKVAVLEYLLNFIIELHKTKLFAHLEKQLTQNYIDELLEKTARK